MAGAGKGRSRLLGVLLLVAIGARANTLNGTVVAVDGGDTVTVQDADHGRQPVRLAGIAAPQATQPFGPQSRSALAALVANRDVSIQWQARDRYGRLVGKLLVPACERPGCPLVDAGVKQVENGMAWCHPPDVGNQSPDDDAACDQAEFQAKIHRLGLWRQKNPAPPWLWPGAR